MARHAPSFRSLWVWAGVQAGLFGALLAELLLVGILRAIFKRQFHWGAFVAGLSTMLLALVVLGLVQLPDSGLLRGPQEMVLWGGGLASMGVGGVVVGRVGRRVGFWEIELACMLCTVFVMLSLGVGWQELLGLGPSGFEDYGEFFGPMPPGARFFGPMWARLVLLACGGGFLTAVAGGSLSYLLFGDRGNIVFSFGVEWAVARRHLSGQGGLASTTAVVAIVGIALGVSALVAVTAVMSGYQQEVQDRILSTNAHLVVRKYGIDFTEYQDIIDRSLEVPGVLAASPFSFNEAMLSDGKLGLGVMVKGVDPGRAGTVTAVERNLCLDIDGDGGCVPYGTETSAGGLQELLEARGALPSVILGIGLFSKLGIHLGEVISLSTPVGIAGARGNAPRRMDFRVTGAFRSGMYEFDSRLIYMRLDAAQHLLGLGEAVSGVEFRVSKPEDVDHYARALLGAVGRYPYSTLDWTELNSGIFTALKLQKIVMFLVLCFIVIVAAFNIASTLFMAVVEKSREIGVLKSMGARDVGVMRIFVLEGWIVGGVGTLLGVCLGVLVCMLISRLEIGIAADVYMVESLQVLVSPVELLMTVLAALGISHLATVYPALKAARQRPVDAMRYE